MIARVRDVSFVTMEIRGMDCDCLKVTDTHKRGVIVERSGISTGDIEQVVQSLFNSFDGDVEVTAWKASAPAKKLVVTMSCNGRSSAAVGSTVPNLTGGLVPLPDYLRLLNENFTHRLDLERLKDDAPKVDYMAQGVALLSKLLDAKVSKPALARVTPPAQPNSERNPAPDAGEDDDDQDAADALYEVEPDADDILRRILKLRETNPALYQQTKDTLKGLVP